MNNKTYECSICLNINHVSKFHCSTCGTIPAMYSPLQVPSKMSNDDVCAIGLNDCAYIPCTLADGHQRAEWGHTRKVYLRTVKADYYAESA